MDNSKEDKKKRKETNSNDDSLDKSKKLKKIKKEPSKTKIQKSTSVFKPTTQPNTNLNICSLCNIKESKLYEMKCTSNHSICFKCLYDFFLIKSFVSFIFKLFLLIILIISSFFSFIKQLLCPSCSYLQHNLQI